MGPVTTITSPGSTLLSTKGLPSTKPMPILVNITWSRESLGITLKSPPSKAIWYSSNMLLYELIIFFKSFNGNPSSTTMESMKAMGSAPITAKSFIVPLAASFPMSPPGKNTGLTV